MKTKCRLKKLLVLSLCVALLSENAGIPVYARSGTVAGEEWTKDLENGVTDAENGTTDSDVERVAFFVAETDGAEEIIASGQDYGLSWSITEGGVLTIAGSMDEGTNAIIFPKWSAYADKVTSAIVTAQNVTTTCSWFSRCTNLTEVDFSGFDTSRLESMRDMFLGCRSLTSLDLSNFDTSHVTDMHGVFSFCSSLTSLNVSHFNTSEVTNMGSMFSGCTSLTSLDLSKFDTGKVTTMVEMFGRCKRLTELNLERFDTSQVKEFDSMFSDCSSLTTLDVSHFDTSQAKSIGSMFARCSGLTSLDLSHFNTSQVTDMGYLFQGSTGLTSVNLSNFDTTQVTSMEGMFAVCSGLTSLNLSHFDTGKVQKMHTMFVYCESLISLDVSSFNTSLVTDTQEMFRGCDRLTSLNLGNFDLSSVTVEKNGSGMLLECTALEWIQTPKNVAVDIKLPVNMYDGAGQVYSSLPIGGAESIKLTKQKSGGSGGGSHDGEGEGGSQGGESGGGNQDGDDQGGEGEGGNQGDTDDNASLTIKAIPDQIYTGAAIKPEVTVTCGKRTLVAGKDYTVSYKNNTNAALSSSAQAPCVIVKGKGNLSGSATIHFTISRKKLADTDGTEGLLEIGYGKVLSVAKNTKANPAIYYGTKKLTAGKDYDLSTSKGTVSVPENITKDCKLYVIGKGNFEGALEIDVKAVDSKSLRKISVTQAKGFQAVYDGKEHNLKFGSISGGANVEVTAKGVDSMLQEGRDYYVVYPANVTDAGTVKYTVVGMGEYTGSVTKSYKIVPIKASSEQITVNFTGQGKANAYAFNAAGVTVDQLKVTYKNASSPLNGQVLTAGKDYKVSYSGNKKTGTAKLNISFLGNFKGSKKKTESFTIGAAALNDKTHEVKVAIPDKVYSGKANIYKSAPIVTIDGVTVKASNYKVSYYSDKAMSQSSLISSKNKVALGEGDDFAIVYVKIEGKGSYLPGDAYALTGSYKVCKKSDHVIDLSGAKVSFYDKDGAQITKLAYTGRAVEPYKTKVTCKVDKKDVVLAEGQYSVSYLNNVNKGKVTVLITGTGVKGEGGVSFVGSKTASYSIFAAPLGDK